MDILPKNSKTIKMKRKYWGLRGIFFSDWSKSHLRPMSHYFLSNLGVGGCGFRQKMMNPN